MDYRDFGYNQFLEANPYLSYVKSSSIDLKGSIPIGSIPLDKTFGQLLTERLADGSVTNAKISSISADKIETGDITVLVDIGSSSSGFVRIDGENNRIIVNDGTNDRILIGYQSAGF